MSDDFDPTSVTWVQSPKAVRALCDQILHHAHVVVIDLETTGLDEWATGKNPEWPCAARVVLASITLPVADDQLDPPTWVIPLSHPDSPLLGQWRTQFTAIARAIKQSGHPIINHNVKFDLRWTHAHTGIDLSAQIDWDTQVAAFLLDENNSTKLKVVVPQIFGIEAWDDFDLSTPGAAEKVPLIDLGLYAARDTYWTWRLSQHQKYRMFLTEFNAEPPLFPEEAQEARLGQLARKCVMPTVATMTQIEQRGFLLDASLVQTKLEENMAITEEQYRWLVDRYPMDPDRDPSFSASSIWFRDWADKAVAAGDLTIDALTKTGKAQWSKTVLTRQARKGSKVAEALLAHRAAEKQMQFLRAWLAKVTPASTVHSTYHVGRNYDLGGGGTVTGRLSSSDPNLQQVTKPLRPAFIPRPGYAIADLDYSQIELRIAAQISGCPTMIEAYKQKRDLHMLTAATITGRTPTPDDRQKAKAVNFGFIFDQSAEGFRVYAEASYGVIFTLEEAQAAMEAFFTLYPELILWHSDVTSFARRNGFVVSPLGRVRRLPDINHPSQSVAGHADRQAINFPVQSLASDLMQMAGASIAGNLPGYEPIADAHLVATVHDSIVVEVPLDNWKQVTARCMRRMLGMDKALLGLGFEFDVPLGVEATVGTRWGLSDVGKIS